MLNAIRVTYSSVCPPSQPIIVIITRPHLISPEPQSSATAPHLILITPTFISTSTRAFPRPVSFRHHWTHSLLLSLVVVYYSFTNLLCHPQCVVLVLSPPALIQDSLLWFHPRSPGTIEHHQSDLLITHSSIIIPITHLLPAVAHRLSINTCVNMSLGFCGSIRNRRLDQHRWRSDLFRWLARIRSRWSSPRLSSLSPSPAPWMMGSSRPCSGSGSHTIDPWSSQTPPT